MTARQLRQQAFRYLKQRGFKPAPSLPLPDMRLELRPLEEIAGRFLGLAAVFAWASAPEDMVPSDLVKTCVKSSRLKRHLTPEEGRILAMARPKANQQYADGIGWKLENMWPMAWVLGYKRQPTIAASQIAPAVTRELFFDFAAGLETTIAELLERSRPRAVDKVIAMEYRFYCAHNAVRTAQFFDREAVPRRFDPIMHGGAVHERRHALTWCLSDANWEETDLST